MKRKQPNFCLKAGRTAKIQVKLRWEFNINRGKRVLKYKYIPISVIPTVAKIFEQIIYDQLYQYLNENGLLNSGRSGFRSLHSTLTALLETNDNWCVSIDRGLLSCVIFIDLKAFETIDHEIILKKLTKYGVDQDALKWFKSYLTINRMQRCNVNKRAL